MSSAELDAAIRLAALGFWVFPITAGQKSPPAITHWQERATQDPAKLAEWFAKGSANIGIYTGKYLDDKCLIVLDVDTKNGGRGDEELIRLEIEGCDLPDTYVQTTPTGGRHFVFCADQAVRSGASVCGRNLDIRSAGGYIVGAGSRVAEGLYTGNSYSVADAPQWLIERCQPKKTAIQVPATPQIVNVDAAVVRAKSYLEHAPVAVQGDGGDHTTYVVAARCKDFGLPVDATFDLLCSTWNERCEPPWAPEELLAKVRHAYQYGVNPVGLDAPETQFPTVSSPETPPVLNPIEKLNIEYAHVTAGGAQFVLWETTDYKGQARSEHLSVDTFHGRLAAERITIGDGNSQLLSKMWFSSPKRRSYDGLVFAPQQELSPRWYNLWRGFAYEPAATGRHPMVDRFLEHAYENVCQRNQGLYDWLMSYFAHLIQKPWEKPLVALVFRGAKGVGKNALIERIGALLGSHFLLSATRRYLVGNFNSHLERLLLFVLDEAFWSGDKQAEGVLKDLITGREHVIERKGQEPYTVANKTRICIIGNEDWLVPASHDERRFAVLDVGSGRKQDTRYFTEMRVGLENGGYPHLLTYLQTHPITHDVNSAPATVALSEQKYQSLDPVMQWWFDCLSEGTIVGDSHTEWPGQVVCSQLRWAFRTYAKQRNIQARLPDDRTFGAQLRRCAPSVGHVRSSTVIDNERPYVYTLAPLDEHRRQWQEYFGHTVNWQS